MLLRSLTAIHERHMIHSYGNIRIAELTCVYLCYESSRIMPHTYTDDTHAEQAILHQNKTRPVMQFLDPTTP